YDGNDPPWAQQQIFSHVLPILAAHTGLAHTSLNGSRLTQYHHSNIVIESDLAGLTHVSADLAPPHHAGGVCGACHVHRTWIRRTHGSLLADAKDDLACADRTGAQ